MRGSLIGGFLLLDLFLFPAAAILLGDKLDHTGGAKLAVLLGMTTARLILLHLLLIFLADQFHGVNGCPTGAPSNFSETAKVCLSAVFVKCRGQERTAGGQHRKQKIKMNADVAEPRSCGHENGYVLRHPQR